MASSRVRASDNPVPFFCLQRTAPCGRPGVFRRLVTRSPSCLSKLSGSRKPSSRLGATGHAELVLGVLDSLLELPAIGVRLAALDELQLALCGLELFPCTGLIDLACGDGVVDEGDTRSRSTLKNPAPGAYSRNSSGSRVR